MVEEGTIRAAADVLRRGGLVAFPTETVYGLGADAENAAAVGRVFAAKGRPADHPLIVHVGEARLVRRFAADAPETVERLAEAFWPGPLTMILRRTNGASAAAAGGLATIGLRCPNHPVARALLAEFGRGVAAPSANRFGRVSPTTAAHVAAELGEQVDCILDGGGCEVGIESTILDLSGESPAVLRPGAVSAEEIGVVLGTPVALEASGGPRCSGRMASHYAPAAALVICAACEVEERVRVLGQSAPGPIGVLAERFSEETGAARHIAFPSESRAAARRLYAALRELDAAGCAVGVVAAPADDALGRAVLERLEKAAAPRGG